VLSKRQDPFAQFLAERLRQGRAVPGDVVDDVA
jgi:hypothetical protein